MQLLPRRTAELLPENALVLIGDQPP